MMYSLYPWEVFERAQHPYFGVRGSCLRHITCDKWLDAWRRYNTIPEKHFVMIPVRSYWIDSLGNPIRGSTMSHMEKRVDAQIVLYSDEAICDFQVYALRQHGLSCCVCDRVFPYDETLPRWRGDYGSLCEKCKQSLHGYEKRHAITDPFHAFSAWLAMKVERA